MSIVTWIVVGVIAGLIASKVFVRSGQGLARDIILATLGAVAAGLVFNLVGAADVAGSEAFGFVVTVAGALAILIVYHTLFPFVRPE